MAEGVLDIETRDMVADDLEDILVIERASFPAPWSRGMFLAELEHPFCHDLVALVESRIVGYICFAIVRDEIHLRNLAVHHDWKRREVASKLLLRMITISSAEEARFATLEVRRSNTAALELYKRFGFVVEGIRPYYYPETGEDALIMWADFGL
jgi:ribosomal-protein-alanine N-acetyltransferase